MCWCRERGGRDEQPGDDLGADTASGSDQHRATVARLPTTLEALSAGSA